MKKRIIEILIAIIVLISFYFVFSFIFKPGGSKNIITNNSEYEYQQNIKIQYPQILKLKLFTHNGHLIFNYNLKNNTNKKTIYEIFQKNYEFISNDNIIQNIIFQPCQNEYVKTICVDFNLSGEVYRFKSGKMTHASGNCTPNNYKIWTVLKNNIKIDMLIKKSPELSKDSSTISVQSSPSSIVTNGIYNYPVEGSLINPFEFVTGYYGGSQMLFPNGSPAQTYGCASIAAYNIFAYHSKYYGRTTLYNYPSYSDNNFYDFGSMMYTQWVNGPTILSGLEKGVVNYASRIGNLRYSYSDNSCWSSTSQTYTNMITKIKTSIDNNNPVAMLMGPNVPGSTYKNAFSNHWVTITGYYYNGDNYEVTVSSWGVSYTLNLYSLEKSKLFVDIALFYAY